MTQPAPAQVLFEGRHFDQEIITLCKSFGIRLLNVAITCEAGAAAKLPAVRRRGNARQQTSAPPHEEVDPHAGSSMNGAYRGQAQIEGPNQGRFSASETGGL
jgi:hypothetical protein